MRRLALLAAAVAALALGTLLASAASDRPARTVNDSVLIDASRERVWEVIADLDAYREWNPVITRASGEVRPGATVTLRLEEPGDEPEEIRPELSIARFERKLRWQTRMLVPGLLDREQEIKIEKLGPRRVRVLLQDRLEGVLAPFEDRESTRRRALALMKDALEKRAEAA